MKKILHVVSCLNKGGTEAFIMNNFRHIDKTEFCFDFYVLSESASAYASEIEALGGHIFYAKAPSLRNIVKTIKQLVSFLNKNAPYAAVHAHLNIMNFWVMLAAWIAKVPTRVSHAHAIVYAEKGIKALYGELRKFIIKKTSNVWLACSAEAGNSLYGEKMFSKKGKVINNGICLEKSFEVDSAEIERLRTEFGIDASNYVVGNITRFDKNKNICFAVRVFNALLKVKPDAILLLGGIDGGQLDAVRLLVEELQISENVRFIGVRNDVEKCLKLMDLYLFPSIAEGLGIAVLEAQAAGVPCIVSTGVPRGVDMGLDLVQFLDLGAGAEKWAEKACTIEKKSIAQQAIEDAFSKKGFNIETEVKKMEQVYAEREVRR